MKIEIYLKSQLENLWAAEKAAQFMNPELTTPCCLRCGAPLPKNACKGILSRYANVHICDACGTDEAIRYYANDPIYFHDWYAVTSGKLQFAAVPGVAYLTSKYDSAHVSKITKMVPTRSVPIPVNEVAYSRSSFEAGQWQTSWEKYHNKDFRAAPLKEIYDFHDELLALPEMENLAAMGQLKKYSAPNGDSYGFEMYSETEHFYIWMIFSLHREKTNLHIHYYKKERPNLQSCCTPTT